MLAYKLKNSSQIYETELSINDEIEDDEFEKNTYHGTSEELLKQEMEEIETMDRKIEGKDDE